MAKDRARRPKTVREVVEAVQINLNALTVTALQSGQRFQAIQREMKGRIEAALGDKYCYRRNELAEILGVDARTVSRWAKKGKLPPSERGRWNIRPVLRFLHEQLQNVNRDGTPDDRLKTVKALREELRLSVEKGLLIDREAFVREASVTLTAARDRASAWPERFVGQVPVDRRISFLERMRADVRDFLRGIAEAIRNPIRAGTHSRNASGRA